MKKILFLLLAFTFVCLAADDDKHPWYVNIKGNKAFSTFQLEEQLDIPEEFGKMDTTKQDFMMRLEHDGNGRRPFDDSGYLGPA